MSCILGFLGENFNVDAFVKQSGIIPYSVFYKSDPKYQSKPDGPKLESSGCKVEVSKAGFDEFNEQVSDAILYLNANRHSLQYITSTEGLEHAYLDFGANFNPANGFVQNQHLPLELLKLAAEYGISINLSMYEPPSAEEIK
jgi:hypothetical protein